MKHRLSLIVLLCSCSGSGTSDTGPPGFVERIQLTIDGNPTMECDDTQVGLSWTAHADGVEDLEVLLVNENPEIGTLEAGVFTRGDQPGTAKIVASIEGYPDIQADVTIEVLGWRDKRIASGEPIDLSDLCAGATVHLEGGVYTDLLGIKRSMVLVGPDTAPPTAVIRPTNSYIYGALMSVHGSDVDVELRNLEIDGSGVDPVVYEPTGYRWLSGVAIFEGARALLHNVRFTNLLDATPGRFNGIGIDMEDAEVTVEQCEFDRVGYRAIDTRGTGELATGRLDVRDSTFIGSDPALTGGSPVQYGISIWGAVEGSITGNRFRDFGPAGPVLPDGTLVVPDTDVGYAIELRGLTGGPQAVTAESNDFERVQGVLFDDRVFLEPESAVRADTFLADNTVQGRYLMSGLPSQSSRVHGQLDADPNHVNTLLESIACINYDPCAITLSAGSYTLTEPLFEPLWPIELHATGGAVELSVPGGALPQELSLGPDVTLTGSR